MQNPLLYSQIRSVWPETHLILRTYRYGGFNKDAELNVVPIEAAVFVNRVLASEVRSDRLIQVFEIGSLYRIVVLFLVVTFSVWS